MRSIPISSLGLSKKASTQATSFFLNKFGLVISAIMLILAAWAGQTVIVILLGLVLGVAALSRLWSYLSLKGVRFERLLSETRVFPDESLELKLKITNRKLLPLPWIEIADQVPSGFISGLVYNPNAKPGYESIVNFTAILWYSSITWKYRLLCKKRGYYILGLLSVTSGDIFGFYPRTVNESSRQTIIVYPRIYPVSHLHIPSLYPLGEVKSEKRIFEDPSRTIGIREYLPGDSLRRIHWKASARQQQLQVKIFEPTTTLKVAIFLAVDTFREIGTWKENELELGISTAASLASYLIEKNSQVGLWANTKMADSGYPARITPGSGIDRLVQIFEALAKVVPISNAPFLDYFQEERKSLMMGLTLIFVISEIPDKMVQTIIDLKQAGYKILVFQISKSVGSVPITDITWYNIDNAVQLGQLVPKEL